MITNATGTFTGEMILPDGTVIPPTVPGLLTDDLLLSKEVAAELRISQRRVEGHLTFPWAPLDALVDEMLTRMIPRGDRHRVGRTSLLGLSRGRQYRYRDVLDLEARASRSFTDGFDRQRLEEVEGGLVLGNVDGVEEADRYSLSGQLVRSQ